ncbi:GAF and ANTAR domain-containing protein [Leifsonia sp. LS-T14]|uniref:GAF and ANTAR domain-containing protein n=1 Tax=unclassified Leifsonia TaxID=2663824 RepID=UPI0035A709F1
MSERAFTNAVRALSRALDARSSLCTPFVDALPVEHAAVSTLGSPFGSETVCASDPRAARLDELQIDYGIGPCWDALSTRKPVFAADLDDASRSAWPELGESLKDSGVKSVYAFPLVVGRLDVGAVDLYATTPAALSPRSIAQASTLADIVATQVVRRAISQLPSSEDDATDHSGFSRREVHQATGMIIAQMRVNPDDALLMLRAHAFAAGRSVREVAADVVARTLSFAPDDTRED